MYETEKDLEGIPWTGRMLIKGFVVVAHWINDQKLKRRKGKKVKRNLIRKSWMWVELIWMLFFNPFAIMAYITMGIVILLMMYVI